MALFLFLAIIFLVAFGIIRIFFERAKGEPEKGVQQTWEHASVFERKTHIFDTVSEFKFFKMLIELFGDQYYIFPQIHLSHLARPKKVDFFEDRKNRSRIEKKSVDFIVCDKTQVKPLVAIELDGSSHTREDRITRDIFVNELMKDINLPLIRVASPALDKESVRQQIQKVLALAV